MGRRNHYDASGNYTGYSDDRLVETPSIVLPLVLFLPIPILILGGLAYIYYGAVTGGVDTGGMSNFEAIQECKFLIEERYGESFHHIGMGRLYDGVIYVEVDVDNFGPDGSDTPNYENYARCHLRSGKLRVGSDEFLRITE